MSYENLARKYRPQTFGDVAGQGAVTRTLSNSLKLKRVAHAYLFFGPRGCGKTSLARIFAKALNCHKGLSAEPCNTCVSCSEITEGKSLDVLELDAASHTWDDHLDDAVSTSTVLDPGVVDRYADAFPEGYKQDFEPARALADIARLEHLTEGDIDQHLYR